jgi:hypothetical protein
VKKAKKYLRERRRILHFADGQLAIARQFPTDQNGYLMPYGWNGLLLHLNQARKAYRAAGLGVLAGRVGFLHRRVMNEGMAAVIDERVEVRSLWEKFDRMNAATRLSCKGGGS